MYSNIYDENPKRFFEVRNESGDTSSKIEQKGFREFLLCQECETKLSKYEKYAEENLYGKNLAATVRIEKQSISPDGKHLLFDAVGLNYEKMKLFLDSLLWRILISEKYPTPDVEPELLESLRLSLLNEKALTDEVCPCILRTFFIPEGRQFIKNYHYYPTDINLKGTGILQIIIDGFEFNFFYDHPLPNTSEKGQLTQGGTMKIIASSIAERDDLMTDMNRAFNHLENRFGKNR